MKKKFRGKKSVILLGIAQFVKSPKIYWTRLNEDWEIYSDDTH